MSSHHSSRSHNRRREERSGRDDRKREDDRFREDRRRDERKEYFDRHERREHSDRHRERSNRDHEPRSSRRKNSRSRSRSPQHRRKKTHERESPEISKVGAMNPQLLERPEITEKDLEGKTEEEQEMMKMMGFGGFESTKGKPVTGNDVSAVNILQKRKYRQYMNRKGGFNRPLDFVA